MNSVFNLAEVSVRIGEYDQAITQYMRALELHRSMDDARGAAVDSYTLGTMFDYQGRFGDAVKLQAGGLTDVSGPERQNYLDG